VNELVESPFKREPNEPSPAQSTSLVLAGEAQRAVAEVQAQMLMARANPRDPVKAMDLIQGDCMRPGLAEQAVYEYSRGGSAITGPSIKLVEAAARRWGNIMCGIKEIRHDGYSECKAEAWDLESGFYDYRTFHVEHVRDTKQGRKRVTDERDIYELVANMGQRRKRAVLMSVIPGDVFDTAIKQCEVTNRAHADVSPANILRLLQSFEPFGVTREMVEKKYQRSIEAITPAQVLHLKRIWLSLRDQVGTIDQFFDVAAPAQPSASDAVNAVKDALARDKDSPRGKRLVNKRLAEEGESMDPPTEVVEPPDAPEQGSS